MTTTEEQRLKDAVVEAAMAWRSTITDNGRDLGEMDNAQFAAEQAIDALRAYEDRSSTPEAVKTCEPPEQLKELAHHWLNYGGSLFPRYWYDGVWCDFDGHESTPQDEAEAGATYAGPCIPPSPDTEAAKQVYGSFDFAAFISRKMDHSLKAFGPHQRLQGVCDHIRKELAEIEADPSDTSEWFDVLLLAIDGASRAGLAPTEIIAGLETKLAKNEARAWPDWRTADTSKAIEHIRETPPHTPPSISDQTLLALRSIALTRDQEVYLTDARMVVRGMGR